MTESGNLYSGFAALMGSESQKAAVAGVQMAEDMAAGAGKIISSHTEATHAIRGMGEELGLHMPRFVSSYLSSLGPMAGIMSAAFAPIAVIGLLEVLDRVPEAFHKMTDSIMGWDKEAKAAYANQISLNEIFIKGNESLAEEMEKFQLVGLKGMAKFAQETKNFTDHLARAREEEQRLAQQAKTLNALIDHRAEVEKVVEVQGGQRRISLTAIDAIITRSADKDTRNNEQLQKDLDAINKKLAVQTVLREKLEKAGPVKLAGEGKEASEEEVRRAEEAQKKITAFAKQSATQRFEFDREVTRLVNDLDFKMSKERIKNAKAEMDAFWKIYRGEAEFQIQVLGEGEKADKHYSDIVIQDMRMVISEAHRGWVEEDKINNARWKAHLKENDYLTSITQHYKMEIGIMDSLGSALNSLGQIFGKNAALEIAAIVATATPKIAMNMGAGFSALAMGNDWAAANYFMAAAEFGLAAGAQGMSAAGGSGGGGGGSSPGGGSGGAVTSGPSAGATPAMAPGAVAPLPGGTLKVVVISSESGAAATLAQVLNQGVKTQGVQLAASHNASGIRL